MDFAKKQLEKYGWTDGKGLGKNEDGINTALKPKLKFDNTGLGHNQGEEFTNKWWENVYNAASSNFDIHKEKGKISVKEKKKAQIDKYLPLGKSMDYKNLESSFLKTAKLTETGMEHYDVEVKESLPKPSRSFELSDEQLFAACGGRTAHKGARHGLTLSGKLSRIEKQEEMLLRKLKKVSLADDTETKKKLSKIKKKKEETLTSKSDGDEPSTSRKKSKKKKSVSFNDNIITQVYTIEPETSFDRDDNSNEPSVGSDEGIEQDVENNNNNQSDDHRSFELAQDYADLSKAERKKLRKKRKMEAKTETSTNIFIESVKKRKCEFEDAEGEKPRSQSVTDFPERTKNKKNKKKRKKERDFTDNKEMTVFLSLEKSMTKACRISDDE